MIKNNLKIKLMCVMVLLFVSNLLLAKDVSGVNVPDSVNKGGKTLVLNGTGIRKKFGFKVYIGALYLPKKANNASQVLASDDIRLTLKFARNVGAGKIHSAWEEGIANNNPGPEAEKYKNNELKKLNSFFNDIKNDDLVAFDFSKDSISVSVNGRNAGSVQGSGFRQAVLRIWFGPKPPNEDLKTGLLGK